MCKASPFREPISLRTEVASATRRHKRHKEAGEASISKASPMQHRAPSGASLFVPPVPFRGYHSPLLLFTISYWRVTVLSPSFSALYEKTAPYDSFSLLGGPASRGGR